MIRAASARVVIAVVAVVGVLLDQWTKYLAVAHLDPLNPPVFLGGFVTLRLIRNPGAAFSLGGDDFTLVFTALAAVAIQVVLVLLVPRVRVLSWAVMTGLLLAGIIVGVIQGLATAYLDPLVGGAVGSVLPFVIMLLILLVKPTGLFGWRTIERV